MKGAPYIPSRTRLELANPAGPGGRHAQLLKIVPSLIAQGLSPEAVFQQARSMYGLDVSDSEIAGVISWASKKNFKPCAPRTSWTKAPLKVATNPPSIEMIKSFLKGSRIEGMSAEDLELELWERSSWRPLENWKVDPLMVLAGLFHGGEMVNVITEYTLESPVKAKPKGWGLTLERDDMMRHIRDHGAPQSDAGAWFRFNPINGSRLPDAKGWTDENVTSFRFMLLEMDHVPVELQLAFFACLPLPINAIYLSGGKSAHALVRINARNSESYRAKVNEVYGILKPYGICSGNKNPSRLSRLPGALRKIGASGDGQQRLLYFSPDRVACEPILP